MRLTIFLQVIYIHQNVPGVLRKGEFEFPFDSCVKKMHSNPV
jgi:hypothetical protein